MDGRNVADKSLDLATEDMQIKPDMAINDLKEPNSIGYTILSLAGTSDRPWDFVLGSRFL